MLTIIHHASAKTDLVNTYTILLRNLNSRASSYLHKKAQYSVIDKA